MSSSTQLTLEGFLYHLHESFDLQNVGSLNFHQLRASLECIHCNLSKRELLELFNFPDDYKSHRIDYDTFRGVVAGLLIGKGRDYFTKLAFHLIDVDKSKSIDHEDFCEASNRVGIKMSSEEAKKVVGVLSSKGNDEIDYKEFKEITK